MKTKIDQLLTRIYQAYELGVIKNLYFDPPAPYSKDYPSASSIIFSLVDHITESDTQKLLTHLQDDCDGVVGAHIVGSRVEIWYVALR